MQDRETDAYTHFEIFCYVLLFIIVIPGLFGLLFVLGAFVIADNSKIGAIPVFLFGSGLILTSLINYSLYLVLRLYLEIARNIRDTRIVLQSINHQVTENNPLERQRIEREEVVRKSREAQFAQTQRLIKENEQRAALQAAKEAERCRLLQQEIEDKKSEIMGQLTRLANKTDEIYQQIKSKHKPVNELTVSVLAAIDKVLDSVHEMDTRYKTNYASDIRKTILSISIFQTLGIELHEEES